MSDNSSLKFVVVGQGSTKGRRGHYLRIRESIWYEFNQVSQGPEGPRVDWALKLATEILRARKDMLVLTAEQTEATSDDYEMLEQRELSIAKLNAAAKPRRESAAKPPETKKSPATKKAPAKKAASATKKSSIAKKKSASAN